MLEALLLGLAVFVLAGAAQAVVGFGSAMVAVPLLALTLDPASAVVSAGLVAIGLTGWAALREREFVRRDAVRTMTVSAMLGLPLGLVALVGLSDRGLSLVLAAVLAAALILIGARVSLPEGRSSSRAAGFVSGVCLSSTGINGPALVVGLQALRLTPREFRGTLQAAFFFQAVVGSLAFVALGQVTTVALTVAASGVLGSVAGWRIGDLIFHRLNADTFRQVLLLGLSVITGVVLLRAATG
ncbi:sulfite exporter TauE/SafE family protein [Nocardioides salsibiostraticola]